MALGHSCRRPLRVEDSSIRWAHPGVGSARTIHVTCSPVGTVIVPRAHHVGPATIAKLGGEKLIDAG
jgi:hypothetical protein